ncbi:MAG: RNA-binding protein [Gammaproteobacteria bacterium]|jgi:ribosome-associated heat shock protein Hsp15|nr:RNA-binding protein [Gammaproteobacteria bacterium]MDP7456165.1 S4 domain-containing protein [Gammaproteobacteria bacterium]HJO11804.1 S4 domain-containing protein [Gammaproteobacteria bacterium]|tara:strand:- start:371 stop:790 length:420 start_codon:yes stop_codon:yes gene_type:complete
MAKQKNKPDQNLNPLQKVRLDKWLWAARFYKTRAIAKKAIEGGKVRCDGARAKPSKEIGIGLKINLRQGFDDKTVIVKDLAERRKSAPEAQRLYEETSASIEQRQLRADQRKSQPAHWTEPTKPNKKDRRLIHKFKQGM